MILYGRGSVDKIVVSGMENSSQGAVLENVTTNKEILNAFSMWTLEDTLYVGLAIVVVMICIAIFRYYLKRGLGNNHRGGGGWPD